MKKLIIFIAILCSVLQLSADNIKRIPVRYVDYVFNNGTSFNNQKLPSKEDRVTSTPGNIVLIYDASLPDSIKIALNVAKEMWESKLHNKYPIYIKIFFEPCGSGVAMESYVICLEIPTPGCPSALTAQLVDSPYGEFDSPDGEIVFNSDIEWNCNFTDKLAGEYNITTMALRGIARCLGFGSIIYEDAKDKYDYYGLYPSYFDNMLYSPSLSCKLTDLQTRSSEMARFITSDDVYFKNGANSYKIYAPSMYKPFQSLCYLDNDNSIMSHSLSQGNVALSIDNSTLNILNAMGWDFNAAPEHTIVCSDISSTGIGSSYVPHTFTLSKGDDVISSYHWRFLMKDKTGKYVQVSNSSSQSFTIEKIASPEKYYTNHNGDLVGKIECDYIVNGISQTATPFSLSLEQKPKIISIDDITVNRSSYIFSLNFNVNYVGAEGITVEIEEEFDGMNRIYDYYEPFIAHVKTGNMSTKTYSWVTVTVTNKYGSVYETLTYAPESFLSSFDESSSTIDDENLLIEYDRIEVKKMNGEIVFDGEPSMLSTANLAPGLYIKKEYNSTTSKTTKLHIR